jgi:hypothetical protein
MFSAHLIIFVAKLVLNPMAVRNAFAMVVVHSSLVTLS